jgi:hypothetical protein
MPIRQYLEPNSVFGPDIIEAMSVALEQTCTALLVNSDARQREIIASRIVDLASGGVTDANSLSNRVIAELRTLHLDC